MISICPTCLELGQSLSCERFSTVQAIVVFVVTVRVYAYEKSEMVELSMVALSGCIWLQAILVAIETK